jgi:hypothetical protein
MDWEEKTRDVTLLVLSAKGERRGSRDLKSRGGDDGPGNKGIDGLNYESVRVDRSYSAANPGGDIYQTGPGEM